MTTQDGRRVPLPGLDVRINGPFNELHPGEMEEKLQSFLKATALGVYEDLFRKAMFLAQDPQALDTDEKVQHLVRELEPLVGRSVDLKITEPEQKHLARDKIDTTEESGQPTDKSRYWKIDTKKWRLPWPLWRLVTLCALGALVQGWDQSAVNSAQLFYQAAFKIWIENKPQGLPPPTQPPLAPQPWKVGLVNSAPYLCCILSCWLTQPLNAIFGRRGTILFACVFSTAFALAQAFSQSWQVLVAFRFLMGLGIGPKSATIPIYSAECAPENVRGGLVMMWQVFTAFGIMLGYLAGVVLGGINPNGTEVCSNTAAMETLLARGCSLNWRLILGSPMIAPFILASYIYTQPESPRWLIAKGHKYKLKKGPREAKSWYKSAWNALVKLRHTDLQAARDMILMYHLLEMEQREVDKDRRKKNAKWYQKGVLELFTIHRNRRALTASLICMFAQQFCGVNVIVYYSSFVLSLAKGGAKLNNDQVLLFAMGFGIINFLFALPAFYTIDTLGRRSLLLITFPFLAFFQLLTAIGLALPGEGRSKGRIAIAGMYLFGVFYSPGEGPVPFVYAAESMPLYIRDVGMGCVTSVNWLFNWLIAFTAPQLLQHFQYWGAFLFYAIWCVVLWVLIFLFVPETRILSLEQLDIVFNQKTSAFIAFAWEDAIWLFQHYIRRHKKMKDRPKFHVRIQQQRAVDRQREGTEMQRPGQYSTSFSDSDSQSMEGISRRSTFSEAVAAAEGTHR